MHVYSKTLGVRKVKDGVTIEELEQKYPGIVECTPPDDEQVEEWVMDSICETPCGCQVEPDGHCSHGNPSWLIIMGLI